MNGYKLSRKWFDFSFENPEKIKPVHTAMYFFIIEHCNRLGWKEKFGLPMEMTKDAIGISNYRTYSKTLNDLIEWGFIILIQKSKNQYSSTIIAIAQNTKATTKALDKALQKHSQKQSQSIVCINKPNNIEPNNNKQTNKRVLEFVDLVSEYFYQTTDTQKMRVFGFVNNLKDFDEFKNQLEAYANYKKITKEKKHNWLSYQVEWNRENWILKLKNELENGTNKEYNRQQWQDARQQIDNSGGRY